MPSILTLKARGFGSTIKTPTAVYATPTRPHPKRPFGFLLSFVFGVMQLLQILQISSPLLSKKGLINLVDAHWAYVEFMSFSGFLHISRANGREREKALWSQRKRGTLLSLKNKSSFRLYSM